MLGLPFDTRDANVNLMDVSSVRVKIGTRYLDIGSLIYTDRCAPNDDQRNAWIRVAVNKNSYRTSRRDPLERYAEQLFIDAKKGKSLVTLENKVRITLNFMRWCDASDYESCLDGLHDAKLAFRAYVSMLNQESKIYDKESSIGLSNTTAVCYQNAARDFLTIAIDAPTTSLCEGMRLLRNTGVMHNPTLAPDHKTLGRNLALWSCLFHNITDFLMQETPYPFELALPDETVWLLPSKTPFSTKRQKKHRKLVLFGFDHAEGRLHEGHEMHTRFGYALSVANKNIKYAKRVMNAANSDFRCTQRSMAGKIAHDAFFMMFMLYTRTREEIRHIEWAEDIDIRKDSVGFKIIKARAMGKICEYRVATKFIREFKLYLKLRKWLLNGQSFGFLFLRLDKQGAATKVSGQIASQFNLKVVHNLVDSNFPTLTPSECRAAGSDHILNEYDTATAAVMLQNRQSTLREHYANGNHQRATEQFTKFYSVLIQRAIVASGNKSQHAEVPSGHCSQFDKPSAEPNAPIAVNCNTPQGCLYCENFAIHADETDIRKLLSLEYVIKETKTLAHNIEHYESVYGDLLERICALLNEIKLLNGDLQTLVARVRCEVYDEEKLSEYWDIKLRQLVNLGIV